MLTNESYTTPGSLAILIFLVLLQCPQVSYGSEWIKMFEFSSLKQSQRLLRSQDAFTRNLSPFDLDSRMGSPGTSLAPFLDFVASHARQFTQQEIEVVSTALHAIAPRLQSIAQKLPFPESIPLVKTTGNEEGGAMGYTRSHFIVLSEKSMQRGGGFLEEFLAHELFHVLSRASSEFRRAMYAMIGFELCNDIELPRSLLPLKITNPDAPDLNSFIRVMVGGRPVEGTMVLYSVRPYSGGSFFEYLNVGLLEVHGMGHKRFLEHNGKPLVYGLEEISGFEEQVGHNTRRDVHPEEIMADNFVAFVTGQESKKSAFLMDRMQAYFFAPTDEAK